MQKYVCNDLKEGTDITKLGSFNWAEIIKKMKTLLLMYTYYIHKWYILIFSKCCVTSFIVLLHATTEYINGALKMDFVSLLLQYKCMR